MRPFRETFRNITYGEAILYPLSIIVVGFVIYAAYCRYKLWRLGCHDNRFGDFGNRIGAFIVATACPWCIEMLEDGMKTTKEPLKVVDIAELIEGQL